MVAVAGQILLHNHSVCMYHMLGHPKNIKFYSGLFHEKMGYNML